MQEVGIRVGQGVPIDPGTPDDVNLTFCINRISNRSKDVRIDSLARWSTAQAGAPF